MDSSRIEAIFEAALQKREPRQRAEYLDDACDQNAELRSRVETLLRAHENAGRFLDATSAREGGLEEEPGTIIGRYKLLQKIGEGGFGAVYMAEQLEPVRRKVALKIIKLGMDTRQVVARFESERQALALMDHPNIAHVLDAGATESGRPYFVMELVRGIPVTEYCDQNHLTTRERLELFIVICQAVQHAHQKGIIHRDIKPTNVLVTLHDGKPVPKVIDFGIAKATNQRLTEKTLFTEFRQFIGTPQYMSPEQAEMSGLDVDTRSDIYSLGVLLYELLTGATPFDAETLRRAGCSEMQRIIREVDPPSPSMRMSTMHDASTIASNRRAEPDTLRKLFRGDLDWIVMKSLEKDRTRRYETAKELAADVERFLAHQPVSASPPSAIYRVRKFVRRNRVGVTTVSLVAAALIFGLSIAIVGMVKANREAQRSQAIADFLQEVLMASADPEETHRQNIDVQKVSARAKELFGKDHATVAATLGTLALQLQHAGNLRDAEPLFRESLGIWRRIHGDNHLNVGIAWSRLGSMLHVKGDDSAAEPALRESVRILDGLPGPPNLASCDARRELARILEHNGNLAEAERLLRASVNLRRTSPGDQQWQIASTLEQLSMVLLRANKPEEFEKTMEDMLQAYRPILSTDSPQWALLNVGYGIRLRQGGKPEQALPYMQEAVRIYRQMKNPPRDYYLIALDGVFQVVALREDATQEAIDLFHECFQNMSTMFPKNYHILAPQLFGFAKFLEQRHREAEAIPLLLDGIKLHKEVQKNKPDSASSSKNENEVTSSDWLEMLALVCRHVALTTALNNEAYEMALRGTHQLIEDQPDEHDHRVLLGMLHLRLNELQPALQQLSASAAENADSKLEPYRLAFLTVTRARLGQMDEARSALEQLQKSISDSNLDENADLKNVVAEAEAAVMQK